MIKVSPSILASDFSKLGEEAKACQTANADMLHIDVMDGHFVPNITLGAPVVKSLRKCTDLIFDVHLMISDPKTYIPDFISAGADIITFHIESCEKEVSDCIDIIKNADKKVGLALKPSTPAEAVFPYLDKIDMVLVMTVEPGFGGQKFMSDMLEKIKLVKAEAERHKLNPDIQVDGGITDETAPYVVNAGANVLVAGSYVFKGDKATAVSSLKKLH